jgi:hypothetical protein
VLAVCIPVILRNDSVLTNSLPFSDAVPYLDMTVHIPMASLSATPPTSLVVHLQQIPNSEVQRKQALLRRYAPLLAYPQPKTWIRGMARGEPPAAPLEDSVGSLHGAGNAVSMLVARLLRGSGSSIEP